MGYSTSPSLIIDNEQLLEEILSTVVRQGSTLKVGGGANVSSKQYALRRVLAACDRHPEALSGRFKGLGQRVRIKVHGTMLVLEPKGSLAITPILPDESDALQSLQDYKGDLQRLSFKPSDSFDEDEYAELVHSIGWKLHLTTRDEADNGTVSYAAERIKQASRSAFEIIGRKE